MSDLQHLVSEFWTKELKNMNTIYTHAIFGLCRKKSGGLVPLANHLLQQNLDATSEDFTVTNHYMSLLLS